VLSTGIRSYGGYPDIDALFRDQAAEMDRKRREATLHKIQQLMYERAMFASIVEPAFLTGVGSRMAELPTITGHPYLSPYEEGPEAEGPVSRPPGCVRRPGRRTASDRAPGDTSPAPAPRRA